MTDSLARIAQIRRDYGMTATEAVLWHAHHDVGAPKRALSEESDSAYSMPVSRGNIQVMLERAEDKVDD